MSGVGADCLKTPAFLRREGRRKRKAGAKNEKADIIIAVFRQRSTVKSPSGKIYPIETAKKSANLRYPFTSII
jgi:hypothetical protein